MIQEIENLVDRYSAWLKNKTHLRKIGDCVEITTPYLDHHNDYFQIYAKRTKTGFLLTDDGYVLDDLEMSGCKMETPRRKAILQMTLNGFGVKTEGKTIQVEASPENFPLQKHNLIQAMLSIHDLFHMASSSVVNLFHEDVTEWLDQFQIRYTPNVQFTGKSGFAHRFDFVIPKSNTHPERILRVINRPSRDAAQAMAFSWHDTKERRSSEALSYAILNNLEQPIPTGVVHALHSYEVRSIPWSERDQARDELVA